MSPESAVGLAVAVTYVGGPTALIEVLGLRFLTDRVVAEDRDVSPVGDEQRRDQADER